MPFEIPFRNLAPEFVRAAETGIWLPLGNQINRNFDDLNSQVSKVTDDLAAQITKLNDTVAVLSGGVTSVDLGSVSTASLTFVDLGGPSVTVTVPSSGRVLLTMGAFIGDDHSAAAILGGFIGASLNGGAASEIARVTMGTNSGNESIQVNSSATRLLGSLTPGSLTIRMDYRASETTHTADFATRFIVAQPLL